MADAQTIEKQRKESGVDIDYSRENKQPVYVRLPQYIKSFLSRHKKSQALTIETALVNHYGLKVPKNRERFIKLEGKAENDKSA